jgi:hypothetical protein
MYRRFSVVCLVAVGVLAFSHPSPADTVTHFLATINNEGIIHEGMHVSHSDAYGYGLFTLTQPDGNPSGTTLSYFIDLYGVDLDGNQTPGILDDVTQIHFHDTRECLPQTPCQPGDTILTKHLLNVYGYPSEDDDDLIVDPVAATLTGLWDDGDATPGSFLPSLPISDQDTLDAIFGGYAYVIVHTQEHPHGAIAGPLLVVPEPTAGSLVGLLALAAVCLRRRGA